MHIYTFIYLCVYTLTHTHLQWGCQQLSGICKAHIQDFKFRQPSSSGFVSNVEVFCWVVHICKWNFHRYSFCHINPSLLSFSLCYRVSLHSILLQKGTDSDFFPDCSKEKANCVRFIVGRLSDWDEVCCGLLHYGWTLIENWQWVLCQYVADCWIVLQRIAVCCSVQKLRRGACFVVYVLQCDVTHVNESCHTHTQWVMSHTSMSHVTHVNESCHTNQWVIVWYTYLWVTLDHTPEWIMSDSVLSKTAIFPNKEGRKHEISNESAWGSSLREVNV